MAYRFRKSEISDMKQSILTHCKTEREPDKAGTAWRLGVVLFGLANCTGCSKRERAKAERKYALYLQLTERDLPKW